MKRCEMVLSFVWQEAAGPWKNNDNLLMIE